MSIIIQVNLPIPNPVVTEEFVQFRQVSGLHMFKLHRHLVDGTVKSVWLRPVFGFTQGSVKTGCTLFGLACVQMSSILSTER